MRLTHMVLSMSLGLGGYGVGTIQTPPTPTESEIIILREAIRIEKEKIYSLSDKISDLREKVREDWYLDWS